MLSMLNKLPRRGIELSDQKTIDQARYIFTTGKLLRRHIFSSLAKVESKEQKDQCGEISLAQFNLLMIVRSSGEITGGELAVQLGVSPPSISAMVDRLVERGMLVRRRSLKDRRKVVLQVSDDEIHHFAAIEEKILNGLVGLIEELGEDTTKKWVEVLTRVEQVLEKKIKSVTGNDQR